jgi:hypothetical protein
VGGDQRKHHVHKRKIKRIESDFIAAFEDVVSSDFAIEAEMD